MYSKDNWATKRHISPEPISSNLIKLNLIQENLSVAAETIQALKLERDKLKDSLKNVLDQKNSEDSYESSSKPSSKKLKSYMLKKNALKEELENLTKIVKEKDKILENLEGKIQEYRLEKAEWQVVYDKFSALKLDVADKNRYIQALEKKVKSSRDEADFKNVNFANSDLKLEIASKNIVIDSQSSTIKELNCEKKEWLRFYEFLIDVAPEYFNYELNSADLNKKTPDWQKFKEFVLTIRNENREKNKIIESLNRQVKEFIQNTSKSEWMHLQEANNLLKRDLDSALYKKIPTNRVMYEEIKENTNLLMEKVHGNAFFLSFFKSRLTGSKKLKKMVENKEFEDILLRLIQFIIDIIDSQKANIEKSRSQYEYENAKSSLSRKKSPNTIENYNNISSWTQTVDKNPKKFPFINASDLEESKSDKSIQASIESSTTGSKPAISPRNKIPQPINKSIQVPNLTFNSKKPIIIEDNYQISPRNSLTRVSSADKINPRKTSESRIQDNLIIRKNTSDETSIKIKEISIPKTYDCTPSQRSPRDDEDYIKLIDESQQLLNIIYKQNSRLSKINNQMSHLVPMSNPIPEDPSVYPGDEEQEYMFQNTEQSDYVSDDNTASHQKKKSGWELSVLKIPQKGPEIRIRRPPTPKKDLKESESKRRNDTTKSPDPNLSRFEEYTRPKFKQEDCWESVADFFGKNEPVNKEPSE